MGYDIKCNQKKIKITPGPADYIASKQRTTTGVGACATVITSQNYALNNGGLKKPPAMSDKEAFLAKCFARSNSQREVNKELGKLVKGIGHKSTTNTVQMSGYAPSNYNASSHSVRVLNPGFKDKNFDTGNVSEDNT
jgi:hypothetical protein